MNLLLATVWMMLGLEPANKALNDYIAKSDDTYKWEVRATKKSGNTEVVQIKMTSQTWHGVEWKHFVYILKPAKITVPGHAMLFITGGGWNQDFDEPAKNPNEINDVPQEAVVLATQAGMPVVAVSHVPFQPMFGGMVEDQIISMTFVKYLETQDSSWPLLFPMVKAAVRTMDTAQKFCDQQWDLPIEGFSVFGASKRGWTTWLTGATGDQRVKAIMPIVIDTLNMPAQMKHQLESYGEYSDQIKDYTEKGIQQQMATDIGKRLNALVDPFHYRRLLTLPKLIINGTNDPYWTVDSLNLYWEDLEGPKYIFYAPNGGHDLNPEGVIRASTTAIAFAKMAAGRLTLPKLDWKLDEKDAGLGLTLESDLMPVAARVWWTTSPTRDFRRSKWEYVPMETKDDAFHHELPRPATGFAAAYAEGKYILDSKPAYFCTNIGVIAAKAPQK